MIVFFGGVPLFLAFNIHSRAGIYNYHAEIFGDKAGYYVFLPSTFIYKFDANAFPDSIENKIGKGFKLNHETGKVRSKYAVGVAVLQAPFFLVVHLLAPMLGYEQDGFSIPYHKSIDIAAVFYLFLGIYFLQKYLRYYFPNKLFVLISLVFFTYGTNLIYYATQETGMSHVYSFCLFAVLLYYWKRISDSDKVKIKHIVVLSVATGFILLTRQANILLLPFVFLIDIKGVKDIQKQFFKLYKYIPLVFSITFICFLPQIIYYFYLSGKPYVDLYEDESFIYKFSPKIIQIWFSLCNGFLIYNPIHLVTIAGFLWMIYNRVLNGRTLLGLFLFVTYMNASWWSWMLGCGFGHRGFVDFYPLFSIGFLYVLHEIFYNQDRRSVKIAVAILVALLTYYNFSMGFHYPGCWYGQTDWDYKEYIRLLSSGLTF
jgi:hypothetical protein